MKNVTELKELFGFAMVDSLATSTIMNPSSWSKSKVDDTKLNTDFKTALGTLGLKDLQRLTGMNPPPNKQDGTPSSEAGPATKQQNKPS